MNDTVAAPMSFEPGAAGAEGVIPLCVPAICGNEWKYVKECLDTQWVSSVGPFVNRFETVVANFVGATHGVATSTGTAALHIALLVAGVEPDDEVIVPGLSFIAPANAVRYAGAWPVFVDSEPSYWQIDPERVSEFLNKECEWADGKLVSRHSRRRVKAILPVHILGHPVDIDPLLELAAKYDLAVVEDATESLGAEYKGRKVGNLSHIGCFSFNGNKIITTGGGGMIVTNNAAWAEKAKYLTTQAKDDPIEYVHREIGFNYRLTNVQAAMGCAQMEQLPQFIETKKRIADRYARGFAQIPGVTMMSQASWASSIFWLNTILIDEREFGVDSRTLMKRLGSRGIQARPLWQPLHRSSAHPEAHWTGGDVADRLNRQALSLPSSVGLSDEDLDRVINVISERSF
ncbi:MAG TPA: LegC family aminotransferase [Pyrinomonadaceae bacterium]